MKRTTEEQIIEHLRDARLLCYRLECEAEDKGDRVTTRRWDEYFTDINRMVVDINGRIEKTNDPGRPTRASFLLITKATHRDDKIKTTEARRKGENDGEGYERGTTVDGKTIGVLPGIHH